MVYNIIETHIIESRRREVTKHFFIHVKLHQEFMLSPFLLTIVMNECENYLERGVMVYVFCKY